MVEYSYRWIRTHSRGTPDDDHVKKMEAQGWEPVPPDELPSAPEGVFGRLDPRVSQETAGLRFYRMDLDRVRSEQEKKQAELDALIAPEPPGEEGAYSTEPLAEPPKVYESEADPRSYREQLEAYYCFENLRRHPERVQELADYWASRAKGLTFNPLGDKNPDGSAGLAELRVLAKAISGSLPAGAQIYVKPRGP